MPSVGRAVIVRDLRVEHHELVLESADLFVLALDLLLQCRRGRLLLLLLLALRAAAAAAANLLLLLLGGRLEPVLRARDLELAAQLVDLLGERHALLGDAGLLLGVRAQGLLALSNESLYEQK